MKQYIPMNLDIDLLCRNCPPTGIRSFDCDKVIHLLHLIYSIPANNKELNIAYGFTPCYSRILKARIPDYKAYLDYLLSAGIIETDNQYLIGIKSKGYRFTKPYRTPVKAVTISNRTLIRHQTSSSRYASTIRKKYKHLTQWFNAKLEMDYDLAQGYLKQDYERKLANPSVRDFDIRSNSYKDPLLQYNSQLINLERIVSKEFNTIVDSNVLRFHSNLTNMKAELRHCLRYNGQPLVSIDIANSQPYMSLALLQPGFWRPESSVYNTVTIRDIGTSLRIDKGQIQEYFNYIMCQESAVTQAGQEIQRFIDLVTQNAFYPYLQRLMAEELGSHYNSRKEVKAAVFQVLFTANSFIGVREAAPKRLFRDVFPGIYQLFAIIKRKDHRSLPRLLQRLESHVLLLRVAKRLNVERPDLPVFTIHDSIATTQSNEVYVEQVMKEELTMAIGYKPTLRIEHWHPSLMKFNDGNLYIGEHELQIA